MTQTVPISPASRATPRIVTVCAGQHGVISPDQLRRIGLTRSGIRKRVAAQTLFRAYGVYVLSPVLTADGWRAAALLSVTGSAMLGHWSAAELYGWCDRPDAVHHVITTGRSRPMPGLRVHRTRVALPFRRVRGLAVTEPVRVLLDLAIELRGRPLERLLGDAVHAHDVRDEDVDTIATRYPGHPGLANLGALSPRRARERRTVLGLAERMLLALDALPIPPCICEHPVTGETGRSYRADFAWPERKVILEADGRTTHERRQAMDDDRMRDADLGGAGWRTLRFTGRQLSHERAAFDRLVVANVGRV